ncbi:MAG: recombination mediator RecR [Thermodesulfobacteriota bacterium]|nr:recombination mediator RecR [Thermodesulfobacteriota bacterium]
MAYYPEPVEHLIKVLSKLPSVGEKTATRLAFFILNSNIEYARELAESIGNLKELIRLCTMCFNYSDSLLCTFCKDEKREDTTMCVVENPADLAAIERTGKFRGRYHVLHGVLSPLDGIGPDCLRIPDLLKRLNNSQVNEVILATNFSAQGEATSAYLSQVITPLGIMVTRIASGIPLGGDLEYIDEGTIGMAIDGRKRM